MSSLKISIHCISSEVLIRHLSGMEQHCGPKRRVGCSAGPSAKKKQNERDKLSEHILKKVIQSSMIQLKWKRRCFFFFSFGDNLPVCENGNEIGYILSVPHNVNPLKSLYSYYCN